MGAEIAADDHWRGTVSLTISRTHHATEKLSLLANSQLILCSNNSATSGSATTTAANALLFGAE
jgi:hypothetical protein